MTDRYATLRHGLVGAWCPSVSVSGTLIGDASSGGNHARCRVPTYEPFGSGNSYRCRGGSTLDFFVAPYRRAYEVQSHTLSVWYWNREVVPGQFSSIISKPAGTSTTSWDSPFAQYALSILNSRVPYAFLQLTSVSFIQDINLAPVHLAYTYNGSTVITYVNGRQTNAASVAGPIAYNANTSLCVGFETEYFLGNTSRRLNANIDDVRLYNRALTRAEIALLATQRGIGLVPTRHRRANVLGSQFWLRDAGTWKKATPWIKVNGVWTKATPKIRVGGAWK